MPPVSRPSAATWACWRIALRDVSVRVTMTEYPGASFACAGDCSPWALIGITAPLLLQRLSRHQRLADRMWGSLVAAVRPWTIGARPHGVAVRAAGGRIWAAGRQRGG